VKEEYFKLPHFKNAVLIDKITNKTQKKNKQSRLGDQIRGYDNSSFLNINNTRF